MGNRNQASKVRNRTRSVSDVVFEMDGEEYRLDAEVTPVCEWIDPIMQRVGDKVVFAYAVVDEDPPNPGRDYEGEGKIVLMSSRHSSYSDMREAMSALGLDDEGQPWIETIREECLAKWIGDDPARHLEVAKIACAYQGEDEGEYEGDESLIYNYPPDGCADILWNEFRDADWPNSDPIYKQWYKFALEEWDRRRAAGTIGTKYAVVCDVYEHGNIHVSLANTRGYPDERWDVARGGAVWIPDKTAIDNIDWPEYLAKDTPEEHSERARNYAKGCIETWNQYWNGDVYGHVIEVHEYNEEGEYGDGTRAEDRDACWGHYGSDYTKTVLQDELEGTVQFLLSNKEAA